MPRLHLFELEDLPVFPTKLRFYMVQYLSKVMNVSAVYDPIIPMLTELLRADGGGKIIDLCAGGGGPWPGLWDNLNKRGIKVDVILTDKFPQPDAWSSLTESHPAISCVRESVDATNVPPNLKGVRTLFTAFHHFSPDDAKKILSDAASQSQAIGVFEVTARTLPQLVAMLFTPIWVLLLTPFIQPFCWRRLFFTYVIPVLPLTITFDGLVSTLRSYTSQELAELSVEISPHNYEWKVGVLRRFIFPPITYLLGLPKSFVPVQPD